MHRRPHSLKTHSALSTRFIFTLIIALALTLTANAQELREILFGSSEIMMAEEQVIPPDETWILSSMSTGSYVQMKTSFGGKIAIKRKEGATDRLVVTVAFIDKWPNDEAGFVFYTQLPILIPPGTKLGLMTKPGEQILFFASYTP